MKLEVKHVSKSFVTHVGISDVSCYIDGFKTLAIVGASGSGKSTFLRLISGLTVADHGSIKINDIELAKDEAALLAYRRTIGIVFQSYNLFAHLTVLENIELPLHRVHKLNKAEAYERAWLLLTRFGLEAHAMKKPAGLSGGQRQRAAIVRAVAINAPLLFFDEPTSALDPLMTIEVQDLIATLANEGIGIIIVSHNMGFVKKISDWILFFDQGELLEYSKTADFFSKPQTTQGQLFLQNVLKY